MEAASIPRHRRRWTPGPKAIAALAAYAVAVYAALALVDEAREAGGPIGDIAGVSAGTAAPPGPSDLALRTVAARASRSVAAVGESQGFVAWTYKDLSLLVTAGSPERGAELTVERGGRSWIGEVIRVDPERGLALVRVEGAVGPPLWQTRRPAGVDGGEALVAVGGEGAAQLDVEQARYEALVVGGEPGSQLAGAPVLNSSGRLVAVARGDAVVPIGRLCGTLRNC